MKTINDVELYLEDFNDMWFTNCKARYRVLKGGRATGKTYNFCGLEVVFKILSDSRRNVMMVRQNEKDNAISNYTIIKFIIRKLGLEHLFKFTTSPHRITRKDTGQVVLFGGMNDVENLTGTSVESGYWTDIYFEEAFQLKSYDDFRIVDGSLRIPNYEPDLKAQITFCLNAWDVGHWINDIFFKDRLEDNVEQLEDKRYQFYCDDDFNIGADGNGLALHISSYKCNPYLSDEKMKGMLKLKDVAYDIYLVEGLGCWGNTADRTYTHFDEKQLVKSEIEINPIRFNVYTIGIDTGLSNGEGKIKYSEENAPRLGSAMTMQLFGIYDGWNKMAGIDEYFDSNIGRPVNEKKTEPQYLEEMIDKIKQWCDMYRINDVICCYVDCADVGFRDQLEKLANEKGLWQARFIKSTKIPILTRVQFTNLMMAYGEMVFSNKCSNLIREIKNARKDKTGKCREDYDDHAINAWEYAWAPVRMKVSRWGSFKEQ